MGLFKGKLFKGINKALTKAWDINVKGTKLVGSALFPGAGAMLAQQEANEAQKKLADEANKRNLELWQRTNEYNSPVENMKRLEAAGLNPNMAYGQIADSRAASPVATEVPQIHAAKPEGAGAMDSLSTYMQVVNTQEQNKVIRAQAAKVAEEAGLVGVQRKAAEYELKMLKESGMSRFDQTPGKYVIRKAMSRYDSAEKAFDRSALWQGVLDSVSRISQALHTREAYSHKFPKRGKK